MTEENFEKANNILSKIKSLDYTLENNFNYHPLVGLINGITDFKRYFNIDIFKKEIEDFTQLLKNEIENKKSDLKKEFDEL